MATPKTIGLLMDYFVPGIVDGAGAYARRHGLRLDARWSVRADWMPKRPGWDGVLVNLVDAEGMRRRVGSLGLPVVHLSGWSSGAVPRVDADFVACAALAVGEFRELGIRRVLGLNSRSNLVSRRSYLGLQVATRSAGLEFLSVPYWPSGEALPDGAAWVAGKVAEYGRGCGLYLPHAGFTFSVLDELARLGVGVPEDLAVVVIDKDVQRTAELGPVPLTAVVPDFWQQGFEAARMVHRLIENERIERKIVRIEPAGIVRRASTGVEVTGDPVVSKALHCVRERPLGRLSVSQLADYAGVSRRTLEQRFRRETGTTLHSAIMRRRMKEAKRLLRAGGVSVAQVAEECGFSSVHYFSTAFKREVGETPGAYRKGAVG